jgi:RNA polymerase sigma-70 factor (ECF subfamily)
MASEPERFDDHAEAELVRMARQRSADAWSAIYDANYGKLYRYCHARCGDEAIAAELASSVFLEALKGIDRFEYRGRPLLAWLYRIAHNLVSDHLSKRQREAEAVEEALKLQERHDPGPAAEVVDRETVQAALEHLTDEQQQLISLRFFADATTAEIAGAMNKSESAVYSLEVRALAAMRRVLAPEGEDS